MAVTLGNPDYPSDIWGTCLPWSSPLIRLRKEYQGKRGAVNNLRFVLEIYSVLESFCALNLMVLSIRIRSYLQLIGFGYHLSNRKQFLRDRFPICGVLYLMRAIGMLIAVRDNDRFLNSKERSHYLWR